MCGNFVSSLIWIPMSVSLWDNDFSPFGKAAIRQNSGRRCGVFMYVYEGSHVDVGGSQTGVLGGLPHRRILLKLIVMLQLREAQCGGLLCACPGQVFAWWFRVQSWCHYLIFCAKSDILYACIESDSLEVVSWCTQEDGVPPWNIAAVISDIREMACHALFLSSSEIG